MDAIALVWLTVGAAGALAMTIGWTVAGSSLDARQAKRLFPLCTSAAIAGYMAGSLGAGVLAGLLGAEALIAIEGAALRPGGRGHRLAGAALQRLGLAAPAGRPDIGRSRTC